MTQLEILNSLRNALHNVLSDLFIVAPDDYLNSDNFVNARNALRNSINKCNESKDCVKTQTVNIKTTKRINAKPRKNYDSNGNHVKANDLVAGRLRMYMATNTEPPMITLICKECNVTNGGDINKYVCAQKDLVLWLGNFPSYDWMKSHKNTITNRLNEVYTEMQTLSGGVK